MKKIFWWIGGGILVTAGAFFIPEQAGSLWPSATSATIAAFLYVIVFTVAWLPSIESSQKRKAVAITMTILLVFSAGSALLSYESSMRQHERLDDIQTHLETDLAKVFIYKPLIKTLGIYSSSEGHESLGHIFKTKYDSLITQDGMFTFGDRGENQSIFIHLAETNPDSVVLVGESAVIEGKDPNFKNYSGETGRYQVRGILTSNGVSYEREN